MRLTSGPDPLLYDRCIRRFQSASERETEGRRKGWSGVLEADLFRAEAKVAAVAASQARDRPPKELQEHAVEGGMAAEAPQSKEDGEQRWRGEMTARFLRGADDDFDYPSVDDSEEWDDWGLEEREAQERWLDAEEASWVGHDGAAAVTGETGVQDF